MVYKQGEVVIISLLTLAFHVGCQNSIKPRNSSAKGISSEGGSCPTQIGSLSVSPCRISCVQNEDCLNHGRRMCCPTLPGSSCTGECLVLDYNFDEIPQGKCVDHHSREQYSVGETFLKADKCCECLEEGVNCAVKLCRPGCKKDSKYYKDGETVLSSLCQQCYCNNGSVVCSTDVNCLQGKCQYRDKWYGEGDLLQLHRGCKKCICRESQWKCSAVTCNTARYKAGAISFQCNTVQVLSLILSTYVFQFYIITL